MPQTELMPPAELLPPTELGGEASDSRAAPWPAALDGLQQLLALTGGDPRIRIAILDGELDPAHPALRGERLRSLSTRQPGAAGGSSSLHALQVASILFGRVDGPVRGLALGCQGLIVPIFSEGPTEELAECSQIDLARAISLALEWGANIINISGGQLSETGLAHPLLARVVSQAAEQGVLVVAAAGNEGCRCLHVPAALPEVLAVGSTDEAGQPMVASNWGAGYRRHGILAPGDRVRVAGWRSEPDWVSGTSFSTAIVSGIAALLMSLELNWGRPADGQRIRQLLLDASEGCDEHELDCGRLLGGKLNVRHALALSIERSRLMTSQLENSGNSTPSVPAGSPVPTLPDNPPRPAVREQQQPRAESGCGCGCGGSPIPGIVPKVFALGRLGVDFGSQARRDSIAIHMQAIATAEDGPQQPEHTAQLLKYMEREPHEAESLIWTLNLDETPIYAIMPSGPFADRVYLRMREFLAEQQEGKVSVVSLPGVIEGKLRLLTGQTVPVIRPVLRGMFSWDEEELINHVLREALSAAEPEEEQRARLAHSVANFLHRVYFELRNLGTLPQDRALNYAATNALLVADTYESALNEDLELDTIETEPSRICRPESECWDIKLYFFNPRRETIAVRRVFRFTVDVSDVVPVMVGSVHSWSSR